MKLKLKTAVLAISLCSMSVCYAAADITVADCLNYFNASSAAGSCDDNRLVVHAIGTSQCTYKVYCDNGRSDSKYNTLPIDLSLLKKKEHLIIVDCAGSLYSNAATEDSHKGSQC